MSLHPWRRVQTSWAFKAWARRNPHEKQAVEHRFAEEAPTVEVKRKHRRKLIARLGGYASRHAKTSRRPV